MLLLSPRSTLFPYTTLFRSLVVMEHPVRDRIHADALQHLKADSRVPLEDVPLRWRQRCRLAQYVFREGELADVVQACRSEEHTSELQSLRHLVCRLLLEKKK